MNEERINELLGRVERLDPPPFLLTRIEARIAAQQEERPSRSWVLATSMAMTALLVLNSYVLINGNKNSASSGAMEQLAGSMDLNASNQLYHD